jgi:signal transduction histidine kinase
MIGRETPAVLIVENEQIIATDLQQTLEELGYEAFAIASSADEALAYAGERRPDVVLMDIRIAGPRDGIETAVLLKAKYPSIIIIYLTAHADDAMIARAKKTEPHGYVLKPVKAGALRSAIEIALYRSDLEEARARAAQLESQRRALLEAGRLKDEFLANMSHELRTPLNGVIGFAELMHDGRAGPITPENKEFLSDVLTSGRKFLRVINNVLDLASAEAGKLECRPEPVDIDSAAHEVIGIVRPFLEEQGHRLEIDVSPACAGIVTDVGLLKQILYNYLSNAVKFTPPGGTVTLRVKPDGPDAFRVEVCDTGTAVRPEDIGRLFTAFEQLDAGAQKRFEGAGLGLALTKRIAEAQGGRVGVEPAPDGGNIFFAVLPRRG